MKQSEEKTSERELVDTEMNPVFQRLNPAQMEAVKTLSGPILILAGAGSGKTRTLTHRIANLMTHGISGSNILAVTFTNKAAREMRSRLWDLVNRVNKSPGISSEPPRSFMPFMGTFHGICVRILHQEYLAANLSPNFVIYDTDDQLALIRRIIKELEMDSKQLKPKSIQAVVSKNKNDGVMPDEFQATADYPLQKKIAKIYSKYEKEKEAAEALDFDDLLLRTVRLFRKNPEVRNAWQNRFRHILIDEYQDTNRVQYHLIKQLVSEEKNICAVGDDWQSIYSWRGADFTNILNFEKDFPGAKVIKLEQNYRSTGNILKASQKIITENKERSDKELYTEAGDGEPVEIESL
ncbi:MAG: UvrD-helicase domain-containing protein, partial [Candidatus Saccharibacteria bacterium]|nr:UvrD-helicase domain-containing protein [Candidatus Saccharibacteria bacterium]